MGQQGTGMSKYNNERKQAILSKPSPPYNMSVAEVASNEGIGLKTLYIGVIVIQALDYYLPVPK